MTTGRSRPARALAVLALAILNIAVAGVSRAAPAKTAQAAPQVLMTVVGVNPIVPRATAKPRPLDIQVRLVNTTGVPIDGVRLAANRGDPFYTQTDLDASLSEHEASSQGLPIPPDRIKPRHKKHPAHVVHTPAPNADLPGDGTPVLLIFSTTTSTLDHTAGICLCTAGRDGIYPLHFRAEVDRGGATQILGGTTTYLTSATAAHAQPVGVSWVWPLLDRPHRLADDSVFTDDQLADSVAIGGRLSRALAVVENVGADVPLTLVIDPELLDELEVMKSGKYTVLAGTAKAVPGRGAAAASAWLARLGTVLRDDPDITVQLTPYADPDFESLTRRGLTWASELPEPMSTRVLAALAGRAPQTDLAWPASGAVSRETLKALRAAGVTSVLLPTSAVRPRIDSSGVLASVAHVPTANGMIVAGLTTHAITQDAGAVMDTASDSVLPDLIAEIAIRAVEKPSVPHVVVIRAPRAVDPSPVDAASAIRATATSGVTQPISLHEALNGSDTTPMTARMARLAARRPALPPQTAKIARAVTTDLPAVASLLGGSVPARPLLTALPLAVQRLESSAWQQFPDLGKSLAEQLSTQVHTLLNGVHILNHPSGSYTLASGNSPLPVTIQNTLPYTVRIKVHVSTVNGLTGYTQVDPDKVYPIEPNSKAPLRIASKVERPGRIQVQVQLETPNDAPLGGAVELNVRSTALGVIGVVITVVAGAVLAIALLVRFYRRVRRRRRQKAKAVAKAEPARVP